MGVYRTSARLAEQASRREGLDIDVASVLRRAGVCDGFPFVLDDAGRYNHVLNQAARSFPSYGLRSDKSIKEYLVIIGAFQRFLDEHRGAKSVWETDGEDIQALWNVRRRDPQTARSAVTWNVWVAALDKLFTVGRDLGLMEIDPFKRRLVRSTLPSGGMDTRLANAAYEKSADHRAPKFLTLEEYRRWFTAGVMSTDQRASSARERNGRLIEFMVLTGLRAQEVRSVLLAEVGALERPGDHRFNVGALTVKTDMSHAVVVPSRWRRDVALWVSVYRRAHVERARGRGVYDSGEWLRVSRFDEDGVYLVGQSRRTSYHTLDDEARARLLLVDEAEVPVEPMALWLKGDGRPMTKSALEEVFREANQRCRRAGVVVPTVRPHMMRHTFAVHMLGLLVKQVVSAVLVPARLADLDPGSALYTQAITDPMRRLQLMLGHQSMTSTERYLTCLDYAQDIVDEAIAEADAMFAAPASLQ